MPDWIVTQELPTSEEYNQLRASAGWPNFPETQCIAALRSSVYCVCARHDGRAIGMGRIVGDGAIYFYLQDVVVLPEYRRQGVGTAIVSKLLQYLNDSVSPGASVGLFAANGAAKFYESFGFVQRDAARPGMQWVR